MGLQINYIAIALGAMFSMFWGFIWYSKIMGKQWTIHFYGVPSGKMQRPSSDVMKRSMFLHLIGSILFSYVLALALAFFGHYRASIGMPASMLQYCEFSLLIFIGFLLPVHLGRVAWEFKGWPTVLIGSLHDIIKFCVLSILFWYWR